MRAILIILILVLATQLTNAQSTSLSGAGTVGDPYLIGSVNDLKFFRDKINSADATYAPSGKYFKLTVDLDMTSETTTNPWIAIGTATNQFKGIFDGNSNTITGLKIGSSSSRSGSISNGLFGNTTTGSGVVIKNLSLESAVFYMTSSTTLTAGFILGSASGTGVNTISNCYVQGKIDITLGAGTTAAMIGGIAGKVANAFKIVNCSSNIEIILQSDGTGTQNLYTGGVAGQIDNNTGIINCYAKGTVTMGASSAQSSFAGGVVGNQVTNTTVVKNCVSTVGITATATSGNSKIAGIVANGVSSSSGSSVSNCIAMNTGLTAISTSGTKGTSRISTGLSSLADNYASPFTMQIGTSAGSLSTFTHSSGEVGLTQIGGADLSSNIPATLLNNYVGTSGNSPVNSVALLTWATVSASSNDISKGNVAGASTVFSGQIVSLTATPTTGNHFVNWTENGSELSTNVTYTFTASVNRTLVGNFEPNTVPVSSGTTNAADITCTTCDVTVASGAELTVGATKTLKSVSVAAGGKLTITAGTLNATNGIMLESDATGTATLKGNGNLTGTVTAKQYLGSARNWYVSSPIVNPATPGFTTTPDFTGIDYYYEYMEGGNNTNIAGQPGNPTLYWKGVNKGSEMAVGKGYIVKSNTGTTVQFSGTPNNGDITTTFDLTRDDNKGKGFNLVGNPYPSYIDWSLVATANPNLDNTYYYRTKNTNITSTYTFVTWNGAGSGSYVVSNGSLPANTAITSHIPPTQAFWVRVKTGTSTTRLNFNNDMREHRLDNNNLMKAPKQDARTSIRLQLLNGSDSDELLIYKDAEASNSYDTYDSPKMMNNSATVPDLYSKAGEEKLVINGLNTIADNMELPLGFTLKAVVSGLKLKASELSNLASGTKVYLLDKEQCSQTELLPSTEYSFNTTASTTTNESRFSLIFRTPSNTTGIETTEKTNTQVFVNTANKITIIAAEKSNYAIYNAVGQLIAEGAINHLPFTINHSKGVYVVKVNNVTERLIVK